MEIIKLKRLYTDADKLITGKVHAIVRNHRKSKSVQFLDCFDGSTVEPTQFVHQNSTNPEVENILDEITIGSWVELEFEKQENDFVISKLNLLSKCVENYPIQPKKHTLEFLREQSHLRARTRLFQAMFRLRNFAEYEINKFFHDKEFIKITTPILTGSDAEGAGNVFDVTTTTKDNFFGKPKASLCVTGQLEVEAMALSFGNVYTFDPSFRAENSNTRTHLNEFWQVEPELVNVDLEDLMKFEEEFVKTISENLLSKCGAELEALGKFNNIDITERVKHLLSANIPRVEFAEAIVICQNANKAWEKQPHPLEDMGKEHEKYLTEEHFKSPIFITNYPKDFKAFYMLQNSDSKTVSCCDFLVPNVGELVGGSCRECDKNKLENRMKELEMETESLQWYLDLRDFGCPKHGGFGMGFERYLMWLSGMENIRDVIPFYRCPNSCEF